MDKFNSFSKTQKLDLKEATKGMFNYAVPNREGQTARESSNENKKYRSGGYIQDDKNLKVKAPVPQTKRSKGSQEKYLTNH